MLFLFLYYYLFIFFTAWHLLKTALLKWLSFFGSCFFLDLEFHFQIPSLLCVGSLLLFTCCGSPCCELGVWFTSQHDEGQEPASRLRDSEMPRETLHKSYSVKRVGSFSEQIISLWQNLFLSLHTQIFRRWCFSAEPFHLSSLCYIFNNLFGRNLYSKCNENFILEAAGFSWQWGLSCHRLVVRFLLFSPMLP